MDTKLSAETNIVHGINHNYPTRDLVTPCHMSSIFKFDNVDHGSDLFDGNTSGYLYSRAGNPTVKELEEKIAFLECGSDAIATSSGMSATLMTVMTLAKPGDNFIACSTLYGGTFSLFNNEIKKLDIEAKFVPAHMCNDMEYLETLIDDKTQFIYVETPANPTLDIMDIRRISKLTQYYNIKLVVDNTFATPYLQKPLKKGADIVIHSATKYLNGHGDVIAGLIVGNNPLIDEIREYCFHCGPTMNPFTAWLILRGLKTLAIRMDVMCDSAYKIARFLEGHEKIKKVYYPGLQSHPEYKLAKKQMKQYGAMIAFEIDGNTVNTKIFIESLNLCTLAVSLGDCETLIQYPALMTHSSYTKEQREDAGISDTLVRLSIGIEHFDDIIMDLEQSLDKT